MRALCLLGVAQLLSLTLHSATAAIQYPVGDVDREAMPEVLWNCTARHDEATVTIIDQTGVAIFNSDWKKISVHRADTCTIRNLRLRKLIVPPIPPVRTPPGGIIVDPPKYSGLPIGRYELVVKLRGGGTIEAEERAQFSIVENIYSNFSSDAAGWSPKSGIWDAVLGQYTIAGDSKGLRWVSVYEAPVFRGALSNEFSMVSRYYHARLIPSCFHTDCFSGVLIHLTETGRSGGVVSYRAVEVVVSGDFKLFVRNLEGPIGSLRPISVAVSGLDISAEVSGKPFIDLAINTVPTMSLLTVEIGNKRVWCGKAGYSMQVGAVGLVMSGRESLDQMIVDDFAVSPSLYEGLGTICRDTIPMP